jgi:hypothetical protein
MDSLLEELQRTLEAAVEGMSAEQLKWHPAGKWCAAEILEHLYLSYTGTTRGFERVIQAGKPATMRRTMKQFGRTLVVLAIGYLPEGRQAPASTRPKGLPAEKVRSELAEKISAMDAIILECEARFGKKAKLLDHPILGPLTARQWRKFHLIHGRLHSKQIVRLRQAGTNVSGAGVMNGN